MWLLRVQENGDVADNNAGLLTRDIFCENIHTVINRQRKLYNIEILIKCDKNRSFVYYRSWNFLHKYKE